MNIQPQNVVSELRVLYLCARARVFVFKIYVFVRYFIFWSGQSLEYFFIEGRTILITMKLL